MHIDIGCVHLNIGTPVPPRPAYLSCPSSRTVLTLCKIHLQQDNELIINNKHIKHLANGVIGVTTFLLKEGYKVGLWCVIVSTKQGGNL